MGCGRLDALGAAFLVGRGRPPFFGPEAMLKFRLGSSRMGALVLADVLCSSVTGHSCRYILFRAFTVWRAANFGPFRRDPEIMFGSPAGVDHSDGKKALRWKSRLQRNQ